MPRARLRVRCLRSVCCASLAGAGLPGLLYAAQVTEAGLFLTTFGGAALVIAVLFGRAPTLRDEEA